MASNDNDCNLRPSAIDTHDQFCDTHGTAAPPDADACDKARTVEISLEAARSLVVNLEAAVDIAEKVSGKNIDLGKIEGYEELSGALA